MKNIFFTFLASLILSHFSALCSNVAEAHNSTEQRRAAATCGDPSLAVTYFAGTSPSRTVHALNVQGAFVQSEATGGDWRVDVASFSAWRSPGQPSTVPLYVLFNPTTIDYVYLISTTGSTPIRSGFESTGIVAYVYPTQICNSVPLYAASLDTVGDHWYNTNIADHNELVNTFGWSDEGIAAYVLPLDCACSS